MNARTASCNGKDVELTEEQKATSKLTGWPRYARHDGDSGNSQQVEGGSTQTSSFPPHPSPTSSGHEVFNSPSPDFPSRGEEIKGCSLAPRLAVG